MLTETDPDQTQSRVLVLGATGFVGRNVIRELGQDSTVEVIAACRDPARLPLGFSGQVRPGDLLDPAYLANVFEGIDVACFSAAWSALHGHKRESRELFLAPMLAALDAAIRAGVRRVIFTSSVDLQNLSQTSLPAIEENLESVWPHLANVRAIETAMHQRASRDCEMVALRFGLFVGEGVGIGFIPALLSRLRARIVPYINTGRAPLRLIDGADIGRAFSQSVRAEGLSSMQTFDIIGPASPTFRELTAFLHAEFGYPQPWFSVSSKLAYRFAHLAELVARVTPWEPLLTRSLVFLLEDFSPSDNATKIGFTPQVHWTESVRRQVIQIQTNGHAGRLSSPTRALLPAQLIRGNS